MINPMKRIMPIFKSGAVKRIKLLLKKGLVAVRKYKYASIAVAAVLIVAIGLTTFLAVKSNSRHDIDQVATTKPSITDTAQPAQEASTQPVVASTANQQTAQQPTATNPSAATTPKSAPSSAQKTLLITPNSFTIKAGEWPPISIRSSDGKGVNMPMFSGNNNGRFTFNFPAGPAKSNWVGSIMVPSTAGVGTYTLEVFAQDNSQAYYKGTITINIVKPTMNVAIQSLGYDANYDTLNYKITVSRLYGFSESITGISMDATEDGLDCYSSPLGDTIEIYCGHGSGTRPTSGTLTIHVTTFSLTKTASTTYSLPPE